MRRLKSDTASHEARFYFSIIALFESLSCVTGHTVSSVVGGREEKSILSHTIKE